jgi:hypothetical protein
MPHLTFKRIRKDKTKKEEHWIESAFLIILSLIILMLLSFGSF